MDVGIGYCRYQVPFRTLTLPDTIIVTDSNIRYRYLNGRTLELFNTGTPIFNIGVLLALAAQERWQVHHMDVKSAFLNGELEEEVYVKQLDGDVKKWREHLVMRLKKALDRLKQAPRAWYTKLDVFEIS